MSKSFVYLRCLSLGFFFLPSCAYLYHAQIGDIDNRNDFVRTPFEIRVSETGINIDEVAAVIGGVAGISEEKSSRAKAIIKLFQVGPTTGNPVYNETYAEDILLLIKNKCLNGRVTGLTSIREMRKYPVISGEIVKIRGTCLKRRSSL